MNPPLCVVDNVADEANLHVQYRWYKAAQWDV
jgi:hypothetical protein